MTEMNYTTSGDYQFPNLSMPQQPSRPLNKYGRMRAKYLEEQRQLLYQAMLLNGTLTSHLQEISDTASRRLERMMQEMAKAANMTEELKASDPMYWTQQMNSLKAQAEEILLAELIYN